MDGQSVKVQKTLASALRLLRTKEPIRRGLKIWADAICINQDDPTERNEHVLRMGSVYQRARQVVCWLGNESDDSSRAIEHVLQAAEAWAESDCDRWSFSLHNRQDLLLPEGWLALFHLMNRPYWNRVWIKQELAMGKPDTALLCGQKAIAWGQLYDTIYLAAFSSLAYIETMVRKEAIKEGATRAMAMQSDPLNRAQVYQLSTLQRKLEELTTLSARDAMFMHRMAAIMDLSRNSDATDCRDKVYGILSLLPTSITSRLQVDYTLTVEQVYMSFAKAVIQGSQKLDILDHCFWSSHQETPSWVPDWRLGDCSRLFGGIKTKKPHDACPDSKATVKFLDNDHLLLVRGCEVDVIDGLSCASPYASTGNSSEDMFQAQHLNAAYGRDPGSVRDSLWRTYTANINTNGDPAPDSFRRILDLLGNEHHSVGTGKDQFVLKRLPFFVQLVDRSADLLVAGVPIREYLKLPSAEIDVSSTNLMPELDVALERVYRCTRMRRLAITSQGYLCMAPNTTLPGDLICVLFGCPLPVLLRRRQNSTYFTLIGTCYCHGIANGEAMEWLEGGRLSAKDFTIA